MRSFWLTVKTSVADRTQRSKTGTPAWIVAAGEYETGIVVGGARVEGVERKLSDEEVLRECVVEQSLAGADNRIVLSQ